MPNRPPTPSNPYYHLTAMRNGDMFFGRMRLRRSFYTAIANRQSVSLVGPYHIGKSSLLLCAELPEMQQSFEIDLSRHIFVYLDLRSFLHKTCEDFFHAVSRAIIARSPDFSDLALQSQRSSEDEFSNILEKIVTHEFYPVLLLDSFDKVTANKHFDAGFLAFLRAQATIGYVSYVTASIAPLPEVCHRDIVDSPFFNIFGNYTLGPLDLEEARALITIPAEKAGLPFTKTETEWILHLAGRHPFFIQRVCHYLFEEKLSQNGGKIDERRVRKLAYEDLKPHFADTWERLSETDQAMLQDEAQQRNHHRELPELSESVLFRQFVRRTCRAKLFDMTTDALETALEKLDDSGVLGQTDLRLMNLVAQRLKRDDPPSVIEKGIAIREVLNDAFEKLRSSGVRNDTETSWQSYNILYYRYFKYHLKNEQIAARIGISTRQYFRYRTSAIEALRNVLFEMEIASDMDE